MNAFINVFNKLESKHSCLCMGFRLATYVMCLTTLQLYTTFGRQLLEEEEASRKKRTFFTVGGVALNCPAVTICCVANVYKALQSFVNSLCLWHTKMNETERKVFL